MHGPKQRVADAFGFGGNRAEQRASHAIIGRIYHFRSERRIKTFKFVDTHGSLTTVLPENISDFVDEGFVGNVDDDVRFARRIVNALLLRSKIL